MVNRNVDIIIPVYNAYDDLVLCFESILRNTNLQENRVIFINDKSTDNRIKPYLESIVDSNIIFIENNENLGFSATVNKGIKYSTKDVILLNTDTIVTRNWCEKIIACAYSKANIGTVTPLSNNATLSSIPNFCEENKLPEGFTIDSFADLIERCSLKKYPQITTAVGFCMFIKREVFQTVGFFDAETFGKGYGEENDFCYRAEQLGYINVQCDDTYIYHSGTASFLSEEKINYIKKNEQILKERYEKQTWENHLFCVNNPNKIIQDNIKLYLELKNNKKNVLYVLQADFREDAKNNIGGTQFHVKDLMISLKEKHNIFVAARDGAYLRLTAYIEKKIISFKFYIGDMPSYPIYFEDKLNQIFEQIINAFNIDLIHVHHTLGLSLDIYYKANEYNIPLIATLHDFYTVCPNIKFLDVNNNLCQFGQNLDKCKSCLKANLGISETVGFIENWRKHHKEALNLCDKIIVPSENTKEYFGQYIPEIAMKIEVVEHGIDLNLFNKNKAYEKYINRKDNENINIAFVGGMSEAKGSRIAVDAIKKSPENINWFIFGGIGDEELFLLEKKNLIKYNWYKRDQLADLLFENKIDLVCILPIWPETFCYTLSEVLACGVPVIASNIGALGDRANEYGCNYILNYDNSSNELIGIIKKLNKDDAQYRSNLEKIDSIKIKSIVEMGADYGLLYNKLFRKIDTYKDYDAKSIYTAFIIGNENLENNAPIEANEDVFLRLSELEKHLRDIESSLGYKILIKLKSKNIPLKNVLKKMIYFCVKIYKKL